MTKHHRYDRRKAYAVRASGKEIPSFAVLVISFVAGYLLSRLRRQVRSR